MSGCVWNSTHSTCHWGSWCLTASSYGWPFMWTTHQKRLCLALPFSGEDSALRLLLMSVHPTEEAACFSWAKRGGETTHPFTVEAGTRIRFLAGPILWQDLASWPEIGSVCPNAPGQCGDQEYWAQPESPWKAHQSLKDSTFFQGPFKSKAWRCQSNLLREKDSKPRESPLQSAQLSPLFMSWHSEKRPIGRLSMVYLSICKSEIPCSLTDSLDHLLFSVMLESWNLVWLLLMSKLK